MNPHPSKDPKARDPFARALRDTALSETPEFSETLHRRIMCEIDGYTLTPPPRTTAARSLAHTLVIATAATLCLAVVGAAWYANRRTADSRVAAAAAKAVPVASVRRPQRDARLSVGEGVALVFRFADQHPIRQLESRLGSPNESNEPDESATDQGRGPHPVFYSDREQGMPVAIVLNDRSIEHLFATYFR